MTESYSERAGRILGARDTTATHTLLRETGALLTPLDAGQIRHGGGVADIGPLMRSGVPGMHLSTVGALAGSQGLVSTSAR